MLQFVPSRNLQTVKKAVDIMHQLSIEIFTAKKRALDEGDEGVSSQVRRGKDIMSILCLYNIFWYLLFSLLIPFEH